MEFMTEKGATPDGIHVAMIARAVGGDAHTIRFAIFSLVMSCTHVDSSALDELANGGLVYSTFDDSHFTVV
jgi:replication factor A2